MPDVKISCRGTIPSLILIVCFITFTLRTKKYPSSPPFIIIILLHIFLPFICMCIHINPLHTHTCVPIIKIVYDWIPEFLFLSIKAIYYFLKANGFKEKWIKKQSRKWIKWITKEKTKYYHDICQLKSPTLRKIYIKQLWITSFEAATTSYKVSE